MRTPYCICSIYILISYLCVGGVKYLEINRQVEEVIGFVENLIYGFQEQLNCVLIWNILYHYSGSAIIWYLSINIESCEWGCGWGNLCYLIDIQDEEVGVFF